VARRVLPRNESFNHLSERLGLPHLFMAAQPRAAVGTLDELPPLWNAVAILGARWGILCLFSPIEHNMGDGRGMPTSTQCRPNWGLVPFGRPASGAWNAALPTGLRPNEGPTLSPPPLQGDVWAFFFVLCGFGGLGTPPPPGSVKNGGAESAIFYLP
jgi:hypothetical protein